MRNLFASFALLCLATSLLLLLPHPAVADDETARIERLESEVAGLREELAALRDTSVEERRLAELERRLGILAEEIETLRIGEAAVTADSAEKGFGPAASKIYRTPGGVSFGGYGELLYQRFDDRRDDGRPSGKKDTFDLLRGIVYLGYKFDDRFLLNTEIEYEHASTEDEGEVAVEFAYLDFLWKKSLGVRGGLVLLPMGWLNELHEPTVFLGANRPETERHILPSTWRENGFGLFGEIGGFSYRGYVVNGLDASGFSAAGLREGRQAGSKAVAEDLALTGRLDYRGIQGLTVGLSFYRGDSGQGLEGVGGRSLGVTTTIVEGHLEWRWRGLELRALGARADLDDVGELNLALGLAGRESIGETQEGLYLQLGYDLLAPRETRQALIPFLRWESLDTQAAVPRGFENDPTNDQQILTLGLSYRPIEQIVLKADYQDVENGADTGVDQLNLLLGWIF